MISPGPRGQSKETTAQALLIASTSTMPKPSKREERANIDALRQRRAEVARGAHQEHVVAEAGVGDQAPAAPARSGPAP